LYILVDRMCGIFGLLNIDARGDEPVSSHIMNKFKKGYRRGPEYSTLNHESANTLFGFHRLAINGLNPKSNQPITINNNTLICNGEIFNYKQLYSLLESHNVIPETDSDCEVILHLYQHYGIEQTLLMLDGEFSFILFNKVTNIIYVARDPFGIRPLYTYISNSSYLIGFASEMKMLIDIENMAETGITGNIRHFTPGTISSFRLHEINNIEKRKWKFQKEKTYYIPSHSYFSSIIPYSQNNTKYYSELIKTGLYNAVKKRVLNTERPVACLLSGGLDSSLIAAITADVHYTENQMKDPSIPPIETYSIGLEGSEDIMYARTVAKHIGSTHTEIILSEEDFVNAIPEVIETIESYDTTTVRASIGNYLIGKYIASHSKSKVILNGDGSDELCGGYLYMHKCPNAIEFDKESRRLLRELHMFDVLRSDKSISSNGLEPRTPFLDRDFVDVYLSIPPQIRFHPGHNQCEKYLLRNAFHDQITNRGIPYLPNEVLWRRKEAFSDGVSKTTRSLYQIIQEHIATKLTQEEKNALIFSDSEKIMPITLEQKYYRSIFDTCYPNQHENILTHYWMPLYVNANDASARTIIDQFPAVIEFSEKSKQL
jgi:asparagine synthase (glutamine-hydrolysing)